MTPEPVRARDWLAWIAGVVAVVAVLAGIAALGVVGYTALRQRAVVARTTEARSELGNLALQIALQRQLRGSLCGSASRPVPVDADAIRGRTYTSSREEWQVDAPSQAGFACLGYARTEPQWYQYDYRSDDGKVTATARGDLDGDGHLSRFELHGGMTRGTFRFDPELRITDEDE